MDGSRGGAANFLISRTRADGNIAQQIAAILERAGGRVLIQDRDFANANFMAEMDRGLASDARVIAVLSPEYLTKPHCTAEWSHPLGRDPLNEHRRLIVLRVTECAPAGLLQNIAFWDLVPVRDGDQSLLETVVLNAVKPDAERSLDIVSRFWRQAPRLIHPEIKPTPNFQDDGGRLFKIDNQLWHRDATASAITQSTTVNGLGGVGKSTLARQYAFETQDDYAGVWWLDASGGDRGPWPGIETGLVALGEHFVEGISQHPDRTGAAHRVLAILAAGGFTRPWLLIYDNVDGPGALTQWAAPAPVHVLATTRLSSLGSEVKPVMVGTWSSQTARDYLVRATGRADVSAADWDVLAERLGALPLALSHAAAYLRRRAAVTVADYLSDLDGFMSEEARVPGEAAYRRPVYATFQAAIAQADTVAPGAAAVMSLAAFFAPDGIPEDMFQQNKDLYPAAFAPLAASRLKLRDAVGVLADLSLVAFDSATRAISVHRLVQAAARESLGARQDAWALSGLAALAAAMPDPAPETWPLCITLARHAQALAPHAPPDPLSGQVAGHVGSIGDAISAYVPLSDALQFHRAANLIFDRLAKADPGNAVASRDLSVSHN